MAWSRPPGWGSCQPSSRKNPHTHPVPPNNPRVLRGGRAHCTQVTEEEEEEEEEEKEEEEEGANRIQGWEGLGRGKSLNPKAATGLWKPRR